MSLVPYTSREGREIVLRHHNAIVVRDPSSQRLEIRDLEFAECPTCHQPLRTPSPERHRDGPDHHESYVNPEYFRMLQAGRYVETQSARPSSPIRRLVEPVPAVDSRGNRVRVQDAEFVSSSPAPQEGSRIRRESFTPNYFNSFFVEERELGRGGKGVVLLVRHEIDGCQLGHFACKRVPVGDDHAWLEKVLVEVELLAKLSHPNLVSYRHAWLEDVQLNRFGPSVACAFILQQYCNGGDLLHHVIGDIPKEATKEELKAQMRRRSRGQAERPSGLFPTQRRLPFEEIYSLFKDITSGLAYLHGANYIHRDLKPSNCLLHQENGQLVCLISDFGEVQPQNAARKSTGATGTISYCAPEVLIKDSTGRYRNFTAKSDIFSLGMILYFMCFGRLPYHSANSVHEELEDIDQLRIEITHWKGFQDERRERPDLPPRLYQLLKRLLSVNPAERPSAMEVLSAMKGDSNLDGMAPSIGLAGRRIQNLDSPMPPSTPVPGSYPLPMEFCSPLASQGTSDPTKHATVTSTTDDDVDDHTHGASHNHTTPPQNTPRLRGHHPLSLALSRSKDGYTRSGSHSPERSMANRTAMLNGAHQNPLTSPANITTPLLMPPPTTRLEQIRHGGVVAWYRTLYWLHDNSSTAGSLVRMLLLGAKLWSLSLLCWPYSASLGIQSAVLALAALDIWSIGAETRNAVASRAHRDMRVGGESGGIPWLAGWYRTGILLLLHGLLLWVTSRIGLLCAAAPEEKWGANW
ncbi:kinase-like domain-containing protein [Podospora conica]|nr:kinase-like domain-containing protein [Schizothecium conicum]